jgi:hypothetical protein
MESSRFGVIPPPRGRVNCAVAIDASGAIRH